MPVFVDRESMTATGRETFISTQGEFNTARASPMRWVPATASKGHVICSAASIQDLSIVITLAGQVENDD